MRTHFLSKPILITAFISQCLILFSFGVTSVHAAMIPAPPQLAASSYLLMDANSGEILVEHNIDTPLPPASLTKMMTAYIASEEILRGHLKYDDKVRISEKAWRKKGSKMFVKVDTEVSVIDLLRGVIIQSGNDASIALAEHIAGSEEAFADLMNQWAFQLGMTSTNFVNATGWPAENHYTTARDLARLAAAAINDHPEDYAIHAEKEFSYNGITQKNRNKLLWRDDRVDGLKTGHTDEAGYCLVASGTQNGMRLISVILGTSSETARANETQKLLTYGFRFYETHTAYSEGSTIVEPTLWMGKSSTVKLGVSDAMLVTIPRGSKDKVDMDVKIDQQLSAPVTIGQQLGTLTLTLENDVIKTAPLVALEAVEEAGFFKRLWHKLYLFVIGLFS